MNGRKPVVRPRQSLIWLLIGSRFKTGVSDPHLNHELLNKWHNRKFLQQVGGQGFVTDCCSKFLSHKKVGSHIVQFWLCKLELAFLPKSNVPHININTLRHTGRYNKVLLQLLRTWSFCIITCSRPLSLWTLQLAAGSSPFIRQHLNFNATKTCHEAWCLQRSGWKCKHTLICRQP